MPPVAQQARFSPRNRHQATAKGRKASPAKIPDGILHGDFEKNVMRCREAFRAGMPDAACVIAVKRVVSYEEIIFTIAHEPKERTGPLKNLPINCIKSPHIVDFHRSRPCG
jgi:hypothetical protein